MGIVNAGPDASEAGWTYRVFFDAQNEPHVNESQLDAVLDDPEVHVVPREEFLRRLLLTKLDNPLTDLFYAYQASRTQAEPYQFKPVLKFLEAPVPAILIADEVGLGKTIEAAILYLELKARTPIGRVLVVCPAGLRAKWQSELSSRFDEHFAILNKAGVETDLRLYSETDGHQPLHAIVGLETMRARDLQDQFDLSPVTYDLVIIDEAHHLRTSGRLSNELGERLSLVSDNLVLLTATPLQTSPVDLFNLMRFLDPTQFADYSEFVLQLASNQRLNAALRDLRPSPPDVAAAIRRLRSIAELPAHEYVTSHPHYPHILRELAAGVRDREQQVRVQRDIGDMNVLSSVYTRTRKSDVANVAKRSAHVVRVPLTDPERAFYEAVFAHARAQARTRSKSGWIPGFAGMMRERQAASCMSAIREHMGITPGGHKAPLLVEDSSGDVAPEVASSGHGGRSEQEALAAVLAAGQALGPTDSKFETFLGVLDAALAESSGRKVIVFSFFRGTLAYLERQLRERRVSTVSIHGGIPPAHRAITIERFRTDPGLEVLLTSEVGAEGLDFQFCDTIVNYDLPWNPMKVEQRIGRVDRYGQKSEKIRIYSMVLGDTVEERILGRLYTRIGIFEDSIGDLEPILGAVAAELTREIFTADLTDKEQDELLEHSLQMVVKLRLEEENLEAHRSEILGNDALLMQRISDNVSSGRYVSSAELRAMVEGYLDGHVEDLNHDGTVLIAADASLATNLQAFVIKDRDYRPTTTEFLAKLNKQRRVPATFDGEIAHRTRRLEFLNLRHPLVRAAVDHFRGIEHSARPVVDIRLALPDDMTETRPGVYDFAVFLVAVDSAQRASRLLSISFGPDGRRAPEVEGRLLRLVQDGSAVSTGARWAASERDDLWARATMAGSGEADRIEAEAQDRNHMTIAVRCATLERTYRSRISRRRELLARATDERIIRMRTAEIVNLEADLARRLADVRAHSVVGVTYHPVAAGRITLIEATPSALPGETRPLRPGPALPDDEPPGPYEEPPTGSWS